MAHTTPSSQQSRPHIRTSLITCDHRADPPAPPLCIEPSCTPGTVTSSPKSRPASAASTDRVDLHWRVILAEAGTLEGKRATTHWLHTRDPQARYPNLRMEEDRIFIVDENVWTSAGMTAGIDLALTMAEKDFGGESARSIAQKLVVHHRRAGGQSQHSALLDMALKTDRIALTRAVQRL